MSSECGESSRTEKPPNTYYIVSCIIAAKILASLNSMLPQNAFAQVFFLRISENKNKTAGCLDYVQE